jgi:hypothetical protein
MDQSIEPKSQIIPKVFFTTHRKSGYSNWRFAFWRELFQNSVDAGAKRIDIEIEEREASGTFGRTPTPHQVTRVSFMDDGHGITKEVFEDVFFSIGKSTKNSSDMTGGFGTARVMLCCSQDRYEVHSHGLIVEGDGIEYNIGQAAPGSPEYLKKGCRFVIDIDLSSDESPRPDKERMLQELAAYMGLSQIPAQVYVNGDRWSYRSLKGPARQVLCANGNTFASVHVSGGKMAHAGYIVVRQNGSAMFSRYSLALAKDGRQVIVEVDPQFGRLVMTDNRAMFKEGYDYAFEDMMRSIINNPTSSTMNQKTEKLITLDGALGMMRISRRMRSMIKPQSHRDPSPSKDGDDQTENTASGDGDIGPTQSDVLMRPPAEAASNVMRLSPDSAASSRQRESASGIPHMVIRVKDLSGYRKMSAAVPRYMPSSWGVSNPENGRVGMKPHQLLFAWSTACRMAVEALQMTNQDSKFDTLSILPGFLFTKPEPTYGANSESERSTWATCEKIKDRNCYIMLLNPIDTSGRCRYSISSFNDPNPLDPNAPVGMRKLIAVAAHEAAHIIEEDHNEIFASAFTFIMGTLDQREVWRAMQDSMNIASSYYDHLRENKKTLDNVHQLDDYKISA